MSYHHSGELPEETGELTQHYLALFEGLALGDPFHASEAARHLRDAQVPHGQLVERLCHETESRFIDTKVIHQGKAGLIAHRGLKSMVYTGSFDPASSDQVNSLKTSFALLGMNRKWFKHTLGLPANMIEQAGYVDRGYGKDARKIGKQALKALLPERRSTRVARTAGWHLIRGLNLYQPEIGNIRYGRKKPRTN